MFSRNSVSPSATAATHDRQEQSPPTDTSARHRIIRRRTTTFGTIVYGLLATGVFYLTAPRIPGADDFVQRYFCSHPLEYVATTMFFIGVVILWHKFRMLTRERAALAAIPQLRDSVFSQPELGISQQNAGGSSAGGSSAGAGRQAAVIERLQQWTSASGAALQQTVLLRRVEDTLHYIRGCRQDTMEEHLRYLADLATDRLHQSFALMRTISWAIPILGFLGTVMGITIAIANVTPEQLDSSLPEVTAGLAVAFDTTAQALAMSIVLVFGSFLVERGEQSVLNDVEQFGIDFLLTALRRETTSPVSTQSVLSEWTMTMLDQQARVWGQHLSDLQAGWSSVLAAQSRQLSESLDQETQSTLRIHRDSMEDARDAWMSALQQGSLQFAGQLQQTMGDFAARVDLWQSAVREASLASARQSEELHRLGRVLLQLTESEERLHHLQQQLNDNLQSLQIVDTLEQTVSSLNAAVHVLTAKTHVRSAA